MEHRQLGKKDHCAVCGIELHGSAKRLRCELCHAQLCEKDGRGARCSLQFGCEWRQGYNAAVNDGINP